MGQVLLYEHEDLSWDAQDQHKKLGMVACTSNPGTRVGDTGFQGIHWLACQAEQEAAG